MEPNQPNGHFDNPNPTDNLTDLAETEQADVMAVKAWRGRE